MSDRRQLLDRVLASSRSRRRAAQAIAATTGSVLLLGAATRPGNWYAFAQGDDDDNSGRGNGGDDHDNSGPGNADDRKNGDEELEQITGIVPAGAIEIRIVSDDVGGFVPAELTVDLGQTVAFVNVHHDEHTATGSGFDTGLIASGQVATVVLDTAGSFAYACQIHPVMTGKISVRGEDGVVPEEQEAQKAPAGATFVRIVDLSFDPAEVTVQTGTAVSWTNEDSVPHTVTATDGAFDSGIFDPGASFSWTFTQPGTFPYACQIHPQMQGTVIAEGEPVASASPASAAEIQTVPTTEAQSTPTARPADEAKRPEGVWLIQFTPDGGAILGRHLALITFHDDGTVDADFSAESGDGSATAVLTSGQGEWLAQVQAQGTVYRVSLIALMNDMDQRLAGTATFEVEAQLDTGSRVLDGIFDFAVVDAAGQSLGNGSGTLRGESIQLDP
jgi:plastocyanin